MRRSLWLVALLLTACAPELTAPFTPAPEPVRVAAGVLVVRDAQGVPLLNSFLPLPAYPGSRLLAQTYQGKNSQSRFQTPAAFEAVRRHVLRALEAGGWRLLEATTQEQPPTRYTATFKVIRGSEVVEVTLRLEGGVYSLEVRA
ncbi:hypothetical protein [Marinithermus hydrothermalis]|uniref:Lipoprotein n=1 Tax=Marinithermus hydrothermalis (strain DSM 14884 / JCM 11576 / T1) TaxID=869210 RepID=F2NLP5_MARHT|nr:hypothetical protein [Marinithermus hydrothermalis]AEB10875.1 hypothetical protein Marky_0112 [Marinithermus hydrothermalis DSM 14884]